MLKNYLTVAFRTLRVKPIYPVINVVGLAIGMASCIAILLFVRFEVGFDRFHEKADRIYRVMRHSYNEDVVNTWSAVPKPLAEELENAYPEVENATLLSWQQSFVLTRGADSFREEGYHAGPAFFRSFTFPLLEGDAESALAEPGALLISERLAEVLFGENGRNASSIVGETITVDHRGEFKVSGVFADVPPQSSLQFDVVLPISDFIERNPWVESWDNNGLEIYVELRDDANPEAVADKISGEIIAHVEDENELLFLQPLTSMRLYSDFRGGELVGGRIEFVRLFSIVAVFLLLIATINFMNLATARSALRAKEIGVRKVLGAKRPNLVRQFLTESTLLGLAAFVLAFGILWIILPHVGGLLGLEVPQHFVDVRIIGAGLAFSVLVGLLAGSYPAAYLSSFTPIAALRGHSPGAPSAARIRRGLVIFQFAVSTLLIVGTLMVSRQVQYIWQKDLGIDRSNVITLALEGPAREQYDTFREELLRQRGIAQLTAADGNPLDIGSSTTSPHWEGEPEGDQTLFYVLNTDYDFVETMRISLAAGRSFSRSMASDTTNFIINERAAEAMNMDDAVGRSLSLSGREGTIVGVVKDFHMSSFYSPIQPTIMRLEPSGVGRLYLRPEPERVAEAIAGLERIYRRFNPDHPFEFEFLDASYQRMYRGEAVMQSLVQIFAVIAVVLACLGLFGLATFTAEHRTKEIGVRKVLGASVPRLVGLLSRDFLVLVVIGFLAACPLAYLAVREWLEGFAYRTDFGPSVFLISGAAAVLISFVAVSFQTIKAALADPVRSLRYE